MTTEQVLAIVKARGLGLALKEGRPVIIPNGKRSEVTDRLLAVLKVHRERIIASLSKEQAQ